MHTLIFTLSLLVSSFALAKAPDEHRLATGLGIAAPNVASIVNITDGFTTENPAGVMYQDGFRASLEIARTGDVNDIGYEAGYAGTTFGLAAGNLAPACTGCFPTTGVMLGAEFSKAIFGGLSYQTTNSIPTYGVGFLFNASGTHRFGITYDFRNPPTPKSNTTSYAGGYAYVEKKQTFSLEIASKSDETNPGVSPGITSIGYQRRVDSLQVSLAYLMYTNGSSKDAFWLGAGFNGQTLHLGIYSLYHQTTMFVASAFF
jgi:hypothetical protein